MLFDTEKKLPDEPDDGDMIYTEGITTEFLAEITADLPAEESGHEPEASYKEFVELEVSYKESVELSASYEESAEEPAVTEASCEEPAEQEASLDNADEPETSLEELEEESLPEEFLVDEISEAEASLPESEETLQASEDEALPVPGEEASPESEASAEPSPAPVLFDDRIGSSITEVSGGDEDSDKDDDSGSDKDSGKHPEKVTVVGVRFRGAGKVYYFDPGEWAVRRNDHVIVETARGIEYGYAAGEPMEVPYKKVTQPLRKVLRTATEDDRERNAANRAREKNALRTCRQKIADRGLEMKLIDAEYTFDNSKILFYFTADGRVDFRELVKDLASVFHTRIELRQIGVRDETRILGGYGICGRPLCCHTWLSDFVPVSIKMAKEQNLSLNPGKISGVCGRLMCCLKNETETYEELNKNLPRPGDEVEGRDGLQGQVESVNVLRQTVRILVEVDDEKEYHEYGVEDITILRRRRKGMARRGGLSQNPPAKQEKQDKSDKSEKQDKSDKQERQDRRNKQDRADRSDKSDRSDRQDRSDKSDRQEKQERPDRSDRSDRQDRQNKADRQDQSSGRGNRRRSEFRNAGQNESRNAGQNENRNGGQNENRNAGQNEFRNSSRRQNADSSAPANEPTDESAAGETRQENRKFRRHRRRESRENAEQ